MASDFRFEKIRGAFSFCSCALGIIVVFNSVFCISGATVPILYVEYLCKGWSIPLSAVVDVRYNRPGLLTTSSSGGGHIQKCDIHLKPNLESSVVLSLYKFSLEAGDELVIEDADKFKVSLIGSGDFPDERKSFQSNGVMTLHYTNNQTARIGNTKFQFVFTQVHGIPCGYKEFECRNKNCISETMLCDRHNNCGDNSDEEECGPRKMGLKTSDQVIVTRNMSWIWIAAIIVLGVLFAIVVVVYVAMLIRGIAKRRNEAKNKNPLATVSSSIPPQNLKPVSPIPVSPKPVGSQQVSPQQVVAPSMFNRVRQSFKKTQSMEQAAQEREPDNHHQVPSMYPNMYPSAPEEYPGVDNPEFVTDE